VTDDRHGVDHVLDAIDNALGWDGSSDAMTVRYGDKHGEDGAPGGVAAPPEHYLNSTVYQDGVRLDSWDLVDPGRPWFTLYDENPDTDRFPLPPEWSEVGWLDGDTPAAFRRDADVEVEEISTWGGSTPLRVIRTEIVPEGVVVIARTPDLLNAAFDLTPYFQSASFGVSARIDALDVERVRESVRGLGDVCRRAADTVQEEFAPRFTELARAIRARAAAVAAAEQYAWNAMIYGLDENGEPRTDWPDSMTLQGIVPSADTEPSPRERALEARRNRNTGPARNPHRHRGI
jgi:hypothetical protein